MDCVETRVEGLETGGGAPAPAPAPAAAPPAARTKPSAYTYQDLLMLNDSAQAWRSPLSCVAHIDMNAFFAQCEQLRLGLSSADPLVCVQWGSIIAVSYSARAYGIGRMDRVEEAKLKCPHLILAHTAVFKKNERVWKYVDYVPSPADHKVSLDPYRRESRKIMDVFKAECDLVEKASIDECFLDLGRLIFQSLQSLLPGLLDGMREKTDKLPPLPLEAIENAELKFSGYVIGAANESQATPEATTEAPGDPEPLLHDWDDLVMLLGSRMCEKIRMRIKTQLGYFTSGGVGPVKTIAKLASDYKKPDAQTVVRKRAVSAFLGNFDITDFWSLGGKTGALVKERLGEGDLIGKIRTEYDRAEDLYEVFADRDLCHKLHSIVRGELRAPIDPKQALKSMGSNKNFRGRAVANLAMLEPWLKVFVGEMCLRLQELDEELRAIVRPLRLAFGFNSAMGSHHSKQCTISPNIKDFAQLEQVFWDNALRMARELVEALKIERPRLRVFPLRHASFTISNLTTSQGINTIDDLMENVKKKPRTVQHHSSPSPTLPPTKRSTLDALLENVKRRSPPAEHQNIDTQTLPGPEACETMESEKPDTMAVSATDPNSLRNCPKCNEQVVVQNWILHQDHHLAVELNTHLNTPFAEDPRHTHLFEQKKRRKLGNQSQLPF